MMKEIILKYIKDQFVENVTRINYHFSYCLFPEEPCSCRYLKDVDYDTPLITGGFIDSFSMVAVLVFLEKTFNIKIPDIDAIPENFNTINKMVELINSLK